MLHTDYLIVGQGIAGTLLSYELLRAGKSVLVIDDGDPARSSLVAGAIMNPVAGKHWSPVPDANSLITVAVSTYRAIEFLLKGDILSRTALYIFHDGPEGSALFEKQQKQFPEYLQLLGRKEGPEGYFRTTNGIGKVEGLWQVNASVLLGQWRSYLLNRNALKPEQFDHKALGLVQDKVQYKDVEAGTIVFCEGAVASANPLFSGLPFTRNRGEALLLEIPGLPEDALYHRKLRLIPRGDGLFWCGSNYQWHFSDLAPDRQWQKEAIAELESWLKLPFTVKEHIVALRPTTAGQVPLVGIHPGYHQVAIFNGLGTRGVSSGPFRARELCKKLIEPGYTMQNQGPKGIADFLDRLKK